MNELEQLLKRLIEFGLLTEQEEGIVKRSMLQIELQLTPKTRYVEYMEQFNIISGKKFRPDTESRDIYYENDSIYSNSDRLTALKNAMSDPWIKENSTVVIPKWALKSETIGKYINYEAPKSTDRTGKGSIDIGKTDYNAPVAI
jgi:hypothetical protein